MSYEDIIFGIIAFSIVILIVFFIFKINFNNYIIVEKTNMNNKMRKNFIENITDEEKELIKNLNLNYNLGNVVLLILRNNSNNISRKQKIHNLNKAKNYIEFEIWDKEHFIDD